MRQVIRDNFFDFTAKREGFTPFMYADTLNLVTTGVGNLIDASERNSMTVSRAVMAQALALEWFRKGPGWTSKNPTTGERVSQDDVAAAWAAVKTNNGTTDLIPAPKDNSRMIPRLTQSGGFAYANVTNLTLSLEGLRALFARTLNSFDATLAKRFPTYEIAPGDGQAAIMSMSWAMGPGFNFPAFKTAFDAQDYRKAAELSFFQGGGGTLNARTGRNKENFEMFNIAADVLERGTDPESWHFNAGSTPSQFPSPLVASIGSRASPISAKDAIAMGAGIGSAAVIATGGFFLWRWMREWGWL